MLRARAHLAHGGHHDLLIAAEGFGSEPESGPVVLRRCKGREQPKAHKYKDDWFLFLRPEKV